MVSTKGAPRPKPHVAGRPVPVRVPGHRGTGPAASPQQNSAARSALCGRRNVVLALAASLLLLIATLAFVVDFSGLSGVFGGGRAMGSGSDGGGVGVASGTRDVAVLEGVNGRPVAPRDGVAPDALAPPEAPASSPPFPPAAEEQPHRGAAHLRGGSDGAGDNGSNSAGVGTAPADAADGSGADAMGGSADADASGDGEAAAAAAAAAAASTGASDAGAAPGSGHPQAGSQQESGSSGGEADAAADAAASADAGADADASAGESAPDLPAADGANAGTAHAQSGTGSGPGTSPGAAATEAPPAAGDPSTALQRLGGFPYSHQDPGHPTLPACPYGLAAQGRSDNLALYRPLVQSHAATGYNPEGYDGDAHNYLYVDGGKYVMVEAHGAGVVQTLWVAESNKPPRPNWKITFELDGVATVAETNHICNNEKKPFKTPFGKASNSKIGDGCYDVTSLSWRHHARVYVEAAPGTQFIAAHTFYYEVTYVTMPALPDCVMSAPDEIAAWDAALKAYGSVTDSVRAGTPNVAPEVEAAMTTIAGEATAVPAQGERALLWSTPAGEERGGVIESFEIKRSGGAAVDVEGLFVEAYWDGGDAAPGASDGEDALGHVDGGGPEAGASPQVRVPISYLFFEDPVAPAADIRSWVVWRDAAHNLGRLLLPMPFARTAHVYLHSEVADAHKLEGVTVTATMRVAPAYPAGLEWLYFRATFHSTGEGRLPSGKPGPLLPIKDAAHARGHVVGALFKVDSDDTRARVQPVLDAGLKVSPFVYEGDPHIRVDQSRSTVYEGSGHEDFALDAHGFDVVSSHMRGATHFTNTEHAGAITVKYQAYRLFPLTTPWVFRDGIDFTLDHGDGHRGGVNEAIALWRAVVLWYGRVDRPGLALTDAFGVTAPEPRHAYSAGEAAVALTTSGRFEAGSSGDQETHTFDGYITPTGSTFTVKVDPRNRGVVLRRTYDHGYANQRARVLVDGAEAGVWFDGGMNRFFELRESDFTVSPALTEGKSSIKVQLENMADLSALPGQSNDKVEWYAEFTPESKEFREAHVLRWMAPAANQHWTEFEYAVLSLV